MASAQPPQTPTVDAVAFEKLARRVDWLYEEVRYIRHSLETLKQQQQKQQHLPPYDRHYPYQSYSAETWDRTAITQRHQRQQPTSYGPDYIPHQLPPLTSASSIIASNRMLYRDRDSRKTRTLSQQDDAMTSSIIRHQSYPIPTNTFGDERPASYPSLHYLQNQLTSQKQQHVSSSKVIQSLHTLQTKPDTSGQHDPDSPQSLHSIDQSKQHNTEKLSSTTTAASTATTTLPPLTVPDNLEITDIVTFWERGLGDLPPISEWEPEDKLRNREPLETLFKVRI